ncbi:FAD-dependent oxidoreductase [Candidatus Palauibacter sp.]|uniref:FAD-dependent oxidoreductase n=1 Tax=Candidatus Palauibacter sp. TaxID=3101350 RepID=UPI003B58CECF
MKGGYDFVIAGGGVIGASIAFHLAELSDASVALFDRGEVCSGGTGRSCAIIRSGLSGIP